MAIVDIAILGLTGVAIPWAIVELGLSAYLINTTDNFRYWGLQMYADRTDFLLFASIWTILVAGSLLAAPFALRRNGKAERYATYASLALNTITMVFWLAGFAAFANLFAGELTGILVLNSTGDVEELLATPSSISKATLAFAIMLWLIFLALTVLNFLTCFGILHSERLGYTSFSAKTSTTASATVAVPEKPTEENSVPVDNAAQPTNGHNSAEHTA